MITQTPHVLDFMKPVTESKYFHENSKVVTGHKLLLMYKDSYQAKARLVILSSIPPRYLAALIISAREYHIIIVSNMMNFH